MFKSLNYINKINGWNVYKICENYCFIHRYSQNLNDVN